MEGLFFFVGFGAILTAALITFIYVIIQEVRK